MDKRILDASERRTGMAGLLKKPGMHTVKINEIFTFKNEKLHTECHYKMVQMQESVSSLSLSLASSVFNDKGGLW